MTVAKIVQVVRNCRECPNRSYYSGGRYTCFATYDGSPYSDRMLDEGHTAEAPIPSWCPLEDYKKLPVRKDNMTEEQHAAWLLGVEKLAEMLARC